MKYQKDRQFYKLHLNNSNISNVISDLHEKVKSLNDKYTIGILNDLSLLSNQYNAIERENMLGLISYNDTYKFERTRIVNALIQLIDEIPNSCFDE